MTAPFRLAHVSDAHLGPLPAFGIAHWNVKRVLGFLNWQRGRRFVHLMEIADRIIADAQAQRPDHVAVTGDLCNIGLPEEYVRALTWLRSVGPADKVTVIPGNHDIYTTLGDDPGVGRWQAYMCGNEGSEPGKGVEFPFVRRLGGVALIGLNSAVPTPPFVAAGELGEAQIADLASILRRLGAEGAIRVVLIHHPPLPGQAARLRALRDAGALGSVLGRHGAELVLHGHNHRNSLIFAPARERKIPVVGVATASAVKAHHGEGLASYNIYEFSGEGRSARIEMVRRGLAEPGGPVVELERHSLAPEVV